MKTPAPIVLSEEERTTLLLWSRLPSIVRLALRARIILLAADGKASRAIAAELGTSLKTVSLWRRRFEAHRLQGIEREAPRGRPTSSVAQALACRIVATTASPPPDNAPRWTTRSLARELGVSPSLIQRVWKAHGLRPC